MALHGGHGHDNKLLSSSGYLSEITLTYAPPRRRRGDSRDSRDFRYSRGGYSHACFLPRTPRT